MSNYLSPIQPWVRAIMEDREENPINIINKNPYVVLSSGALVVNGNDTKLNQARYEERMAKMDQIIADPPADCYNGCIISNNINNLELSYSLNETPVGIDFKGRVITVKGETGRKVSTPIVTSVDIDTEETNNTLKTTRVQVKCFTLKQFEMFELFFMKPGMNILVEWGDSSLLKRTNQTKFFTKQDSTVFLQNGKKVTFSPHTLPEESLFVTGKTFEEFCDKFSDIYITTPTSSLDIQKNIRQSLGSYDYAAGKVTDYSYSISEDGTFDIMLEVSQGNQMSLALPKNPVNNGAAKKQAKGTKNKGSTISKYTQIKECIISDLNLDTATFSDILASTPHTIPNGKWEDDFFNFLKKNEQQKDTLSNADAYVSLRFILAILANYSVYKDTEFKFELPKYINKSKGGKAESIIPVHSSKFMLSSSPDVLFPLKNVPLVTTGSKGVGDANEIIIQSGSKVDGRIGAGQYDFHIESTYAPPPSTCSIPPDITPIIEGAPTGNALNIFLKYDTVVRIWNANYTRIDFLKDVLDIVNKNGYGLYNLVIQPQEQGGPSTTICYKFANQDVKSVQNNDDSIGYRFKPTTINSIVRNFSYNFQLDNLIAGRMIFNSNAGIRNALNNKSSNKTPTASTAKNKKGKANSTQSTNSGVIPFPAASYRSFDYSTFSNADGFYSINNVDRRRQQKIFQEYINKNTTATANIVDSKLTDATTTKDPLPDFTQTIKSNSLFYKVNEKKDPVRLVYKNRPLIHGAINTDLGPNGAGKSTLTNIEISITIDGFSGFRSGECFNIDGIPEIYNQQGVFQITNIKHNITDTDGWTTTLEAMWRVGMK